MSDNTNTTTVGIDSKNEFIAQVKETGVVAGGDLVHTEGEGRATRYFVGDEQVKKAEVEDLYAEQDEVEVPVEREFDHGDIACRVCGNVVGYLTGSHMKTHDEGEPRSVAEYRAHVADKDGVEPSEVPLAPEELTEVFHASGDLSDETRRQLSETNKARWEAGEYDHLRKEDADDGSDDDGSDDDGDEEAVEAAA